jgi:eukaryotic-like serine/threonine-protein kinase
VPRVVGKTVKAARELLDRRDCRLGKVASAYSPTAKGKVISQNPKPGANLRENAKVNVVTSRGPKPKAHQRPH